MKRFFTLVLLSFCFVHLGFAQNNNVIDPELYALMNSRSGDKISVNIILKEDVNASSLNVRKAFHNKDAKRTYMVNELKTQSEKLQADVLKTLKAVERSSQMTDINCHWLTNMINCKATADAILKIAEHPDVKAIIYNKKEYMLFDEKKESGTPNRAYNGTNVEKINAHKVWEMGFTGDGIIVAVLDTGVNTDHVDLKNHLWDDGNGHHGVNTLVGDPYFPQYTDRYDVSDAEGHGTHCAGTVCGDGTSGTITGMAPNAELMCVKVLGDEGEGTLETILAGVEYAVENGADVLSMSLGISGPTDAVNEVVREAFENMLPLDVVAAVAAGNDGAKQGEYPIPYNINAPASCPPPYLSSDQTEVGGKTNVICVGAVNYSDQSCGFSSEGPVTWQKTKYGDYKLGKTYSTTTLQYDNGTYSKSYNYSDVSDCFGVMFPPTKLSGLGSVLASVSIYDAVSDAGIIEIFSGGSTPSEGTKIHSQTYQINGTKSMVDINMLTDVNIDITKNLWIIFTSYSSATPIPVSVSKSKTDANGRWVYKDSAWSNSIITNKESIMVRANIATGAPIEEYIGLIRPDICAPGDNIQSASNIDNEWYDWLSGTSMATPCVAGAIALLLEAKPSLTPAEICEALETTAVKVGGATSKNNKTGSGRIDVYEALLTIADIPLTAPELTATATGTSSINLSWTKAGAESYTVYRDGSTIASNVTATTYTDSGLDAETQYCYQIKAVKGTESQKSNEECVKTQAEGATPGTGKYRIKAVDRSATAGVSYYLNIENDDQHEYGSKGGVGLATYAENDRQIFEIEPVYGNSIYLKSATGHYIYCNGGWNVDAFSTYSATSLEFVDTGLGNNTFYINSSKGWFKVGKEDGGSNYYPYSNGTTSNREKWILEEVGSSTPDPDPTPTVPNAPATLTATAQSTSVINLSWSSVAEATSYNVYRGLSKIANVATGTTYSDTGLNPGTEYCYTVTSVNSAVESTKMNEACARTLTAVTMPGAFTLTATPQSTSSIALSWTASSGATSYDVYRATLKIATGLTTSSFTDTGLNSNQEYCYSIVAVNTAGMTESNVVCATTQSENAGGGGGGVDGVVSIGYPTTSVTPNLPFDTYYAYSFSQQIYTKAEIDPDGTMSGGMITKIAFKQANDLKVNRTIAVYMQNATAEELTSWISVTDDTEVFDGTISTPGKDQYLEIRLDTPLEYTGGNLLISVFDKSDSYSNYGRFYCYGADNRSLIHSNYGSHTNVDPANMKYTGNKIGKNNAIDITFEAAAEVIPFPQNVKATPANIFVDQSTTISWDACDGATSYNVYVNGVKHGSSATTSYALSNLSYNVDPGVQINVTAVVDGNESELSKDVFVKVGAYFPLTVNVVDNLGNPMQGVSVTVDGVDEIGNTVNNTYTSDANGNISVAKMPLPMFNNCYNFVAIKSIFEGYATVCDYDNPPMDVARDVEYVLTIVMELPQPMNLRADKDIYSVGEDVVLSWDEINLSSLQGYNLYEKYWDAGISAYAYEKINATLISKNATTYTIVGGLPIRGCTNTICLTAVYTEGETTKGSPSVTVSKTGTGTMDGIVVTESGAPVSGVSVTVRGTNCEGSDVYEYTYTTGADGKFGGDMPMGTYNIFATKPGSNYNDRSIYDILISHDNVTNVVVELWEKGDKYEIEKEIGENTKPYVDYIGPVLPISTGFEYSASQQIYTKEELNFASSTDVEITSISFRVYGNTNSGKTDAVEIYVQNTDKSEFANLRDWIQVTDNDRVFNGQYVMPSDGEWVTFEFDDPIVYTGGNLLVGAKRRDDKLQQSGFYVYDTENIRSLCGANDNNDPVNNYVDATALYKVNTIKLTYTSTSPEVAVTPNPIDFGEVIVGDYWREKPDATASVQINAYNTKLNSVTVDNPFFTIPSFDINSTALSIDMGYNRNNTPGYKAGTLSVTPKKGVVKEVKVTATAYDPVEPDVLEKPREVVWTNDEYEDTPAFAILHDDYVMPSEIEENAKKDAVYKFTLEGDAYVTAKIYNGSNAALAFYKEDFANDAVDKDGPSTDNTYYGIGGAPTDETVDICILGDDCDGTLPGWTFLNKSDSNKGFGWFVSDGSGTMSGWYGPSGANDWMLGSRKYWYGYGVEGVLSPENYVYTTDKYKITAMSQISFEHRHSDGSGSYWKDMFDIVISEDGTNFTSVKQIVYADILTKSLEADQWLTAIVSLSLSEYIGKTVHIGFMHKDNSTEDDGDGVKIDNVCISGVLKTDGSRSGNKPSVRATGQVTAIMEDLLFPKGTYYVVPAAETEFTFTLSKRNVEEGIIFTGGGGDGDWKTAKNWNINAVPQPADDVIIRGDAVVNDNVNINSIFVENGATLTIESTGVLKVTEGITNKIHSAFVIEDGAQLYQNAADVAATFNMNINNPDSWGPDGSNHTQGWQFIASPFIDADMLNYVVTDDGDYDLYKYDGTQELEWVNYKLHHNEFSHDFANGMQGWTVLDANGDGHSWAYNNETGCDGAAGYLSCGLREGKTNDYLVSPELINVYPESKLRFWIKNAADVTTTNEVEVWLSEDKAAAPTTADEFITRVAAVEVSNTWQQVELSLEAYADQDDRDLMEYWIAIRSISSTSNNEGVLIDKLELANYDEPNPYETEFVLGRGYMASYEKDGTASLQGTLNHETTFNYEVSFNDANRWENFYLIGNPFTHNVNWTDFDLSNIVDGFAVVDNDGSYVYDVDAEIKVGDGVMIQTTGANPSISVSGVTRNKVADYLNVVAKGGAGDDNFIVSLSGEEYEGFKKLENFNDNIAKVYVSDYGTQYGIVNRDEDVKEVEFCFETNKMGYYTISVTPNGDFSSVSLYDRVENVEVDMMASNAYKFLAQNAEDGYNRFVLKFEKNAEAADGNFVYQSDDELVIDAEGLVQIMDVWGRIIYSGEQNGISRVNVGGMKNTTCTVRNINNNEVRTQKIVIL